MKISNAILSSVDRNENVDTQNIPLREEMELRGFVPLEKYRKIPFSSRVLSLNFMKIITEEEFKMHAKKRLAKMVNFAHFLCNTDTNEVRIFFEFSQV